MHSELMKMAEDDEINQESIPKIESIQIWIAHYAAAYKTEASRNIINLMNAEEFNNNKIMLLIVGIKLFHFYDKKLTSI